MRAPAGPPQLLYLPDGGDVALEGAPEQRLLPGPWRSGSRRCPPEMVDVRGQFCIDRFEVSLADRTTGRELSPYYHPTSAQVRRCYAGWQTRRLNSGTQQARSVPVPEPPPWQLEGPFTPSARSVPGAVPSGYLSGRTAEEACRNAGKRLCLLDEWRTACRGQRARKFPYGDQYEPGTCNVARDVHPARLLHGNASINHLDPRLNLVEHGGEPLLRKTGATSSCRSEWGDDALFDMVGNLDEWVEDPEGTFAGGFYSRGTQEGCDAAIMSHDFAYFDYSLGTRCCRSMP
ncbi:MAG TPA: SUMF1/EgtB/PvdO family nonheme iron enzyme [Polyangiaceae bacterium]